MGMAEESASNDSTYSRRVNCDYIAIRGTVFLLRTDGTHRCFRASGSDRRRPSCVSVFRSGSVEGWLKSKTQLDELARKAREMFEAAAVRYPHSPFRHILYAGPAPGGAAVGQQLNPTMILKVQLYEFQRVRHIPSITITPHDSTLTRWTVGNTVTSV